MSECQNITEATQFILNQLEINGRAPSTVKILRNSYNVFIKYLQENSITYVNEEICIEFLYFKTGKKISGFSTTVSDAKLNRRMRPLHLLLLYLETGLFQDKVRRQKSFVCPQNYVLEFEQYLEHCEYKGYAVATIRTHVKQIQEFLKYLDSSGIQKSNAICLSNVEKYLLRYEGSSVKYVGTILHVLKSYFLFLKENNFITENISDHFPKVRVPRNGSVSYSWKKEDVLKLLNAVDRQDPKGKRDYAILLIVVRLGLRVGDIRSLKIADLNWERKTINIIMSKTKQALELPLLDDIGWAVIDYLKNGRPQTLSDRLFVRHRAPFNAFGETENFHRSLQRYMIKAGLETSKVRYGMHSLRSTLAKNMLETAAPLPVISETLGHRNINTTGIYLKIDMAGLRKCPLDPEEVFL
jgi:Site-specific recombinase XerD